MKATSGDQCAKTFNGITHICCGMATLGALMIATCPHPVVQSLGGIMAFVNGLVVYKLWKARPAQLKV